MSDIIKLASGNEKSFMYGKTTYVYRGPEVLKNGTRTGMFVYTKATPQDNVIINTNILGHNLICTWTPVAPKPNKISAELPFAELVKTAPKPNKISVELPFAELVKTAPNTIFIPDNYIDESGSTRTNTILQNFLYTYFDLYCGKEYIPVDPFYAKDVPVCNEISIRPREKTLIWMQNDSTLQTITLNVLLTFGFEGFNFTFDKPVDISSGSLTLTSSLKMKSFGNPP